MFQSGYVQIASFRGIPIRAHWTLPILCVLWSGLRFAPGAWIGALFVVLLHELGHAYLARRQRLHVMEVMLHGFGGHCAYVGEVTPWQRSIVASGGVLAQALLLVLAYPVELLLTTRVASGAPPPPAFVWDLLYAWTYANLGIAMFNLLPIGRLDGAEIWKLPGLWLARRRRREIARATATKRAPARDEVRPSAKASEPVEIDEAAVRETVRRALEEARKSSQKPQ
ncbi:MAG: hypothetical protein U0353_30070 [Sandaracinus sp.]